MFVCNTSSSQKGRKPNDRGYTFFLDKIKEFDLREFDKLEVFCTDGDIKPFYPYKWRATSKIKSGDDDPFEGFGNSPLEALRNLYHEMINIMINNKLNNN